MARELQDLWTRDDLQELLEATRTHGTECTEVLAYLTLIALRQLLEKLLAEHDRK